MLVEKPIYEKFDEIRKKYDGYCAFVVRCMGDYDDIIGGEVVAYNKCLADLTLEARPIIKNGGIGVYVFETFTDFGEYDVIQVIPYE